MFDIVCLGPIRVRLLSDTEHLIFTHAVRQSPSHLLRLLAATDWLHKQCCRPLVLATYPASERSLQCFEKSWPTWRWSNSPNVEAKRGSQEKRTFFLDFLRLNMNFKNTANTSKRLAHKTPLRVGGDLYTLSSYRNTLLPQLIIKCYCACAIWPQGNIGITTWSVYSMATMSAGKFHSCSGYSWRALPQNCIVRPSRPEHELCIAFK